jgi:hypothetical protein
MAGDVEVADGADPGESGGRSNVATVTITVTSVDDTR